MRQGALAVTLALAACQHSERSSRPLAQVPAGGFLSGEISELAERAVLEERDFVYAIALSPDRQKAAYTHLGSKLTELGVFELSPPPRRVANVPITSNEFDVEAVAFSPDGKAIVTAGRDGAVRVFSAEDGALLGAYLTEEPLTAVAFHPGGKDVLVGSARGLVTVLAFPRLAFASEERAHGDEIRGLWVTADGAVYSGGWDKAIAVFQATEGEVPGGEAHLHFERQGGYVTLQGTLNGRVSLAFALDERVPEVVVSGAAAQAAGIDVALLKETVSLPSSMGTTIARVARGQRLTFKGLEVTGMDVAICDVCVPQNVQAVLGAPFTRRYEVAFDAALSEALVTARERSQVPARTALRLEPRARLRFGWYVNDVSADRSGRRLGVAFSEVKAERTREVYEREKKGVREPPRPGNVAAIVDASTGKLLRVSERHEGVVSTAAISPDGQSMASGGWDKRVYVLGPKDTAPRVTRELGWSIRRVRFSEDGALLAVGAWTPQNPLGDQRSNPSAVVYEVVYRGAPE